MKAVTLAANLLLSRFFESERDGYSDGYQLDIGLGFFKWARQMADDRTTYGASSA